MNWFNRIFGAFAKPSPSSRAEILKHAMSGGKTSISTFGSNRRKFKVFYRFWLAYTRHVKNDNVFHVVCGFRHVANGNYILIEAFDNAADNLLERNFDAGVIKKIEQRVLSAGEISLKRSGCRSVGNYALRGCRLTSTEEWSHLISLVQADQFVVVNP